MLNQVMKAMNSLVKLPQISQAMMDMSREMMKAGIISEMMEEVMQLILVYVRDDELEEEADEEVEKVMHELTDGLLGQAGKVGAELPSAVKVKSKTDSERLAALNSI
jgi:charged multivesicular body protein 3